MLEERSFIASTKDVLYERLLNSVEQQFDQGGGEAISLAQWAESTPVILDGKPFSFHRHEYLRVPYEDDKPHRCVGFFKKSDFALNRGKPRVYRQVAQRYRLSRLETNLEFLALSERDAVRCGSEINPSRYGKR